MNTKDYAKLLDIIDEWDQDELQVSLSEEITKLKKMIKEEFDNGKKV